MDSSELGFFRRIWIDDRKPTAMPRKIAKYEFGNLHPHPMRHRVIALTAWLAACSCLAESTPVGLWKTIDDDNGKAKSLIRITEHEGVLEGRIEKLLDPDDDADAVCGKCSDERRNKPIVGMPIIRKVRKNPSAPNQWEGGDILDPENGQVYRVRLQPSPDGRNLDVRGYIGTPLLGRTQTWQRVE